MNPHHFKRIIFAALVAVALVLVWFLALQPLASQAARLEGSDRAHIAVQFSPSVQEIRQITFTAPISGLMALQLTGYPVETYDFGGGFIAVCSVNGVGCPANDCFCDPNRFWSYEYWDGSQWMGYMVGAAASSIGDGVIEGWRWSEFGVGSLPPAPQLQAALKALSWLSQQQSAANGGYGSTGGSVESLLAIGSNGIDADSWRRQLSAPSLLDHLLAGSPSFSSLDAASAGKLAVGIAAADNCLAYLAKQPMDYYQPASGWFSQDGGDQSWAMLGTSALSQTVPVSATTYLKSIQQGNGGWEWTPGGFGGGADTNSTSLAIQALIAVGELPTSTAIISGVNFLQAAQNTDGGFPYDPDSPYGTDSDANSTAYAIQALIAAGIDPETWSPAGQSPLDYLLSLQLPDGSFQWQAGLGSNMLATQQAIPVLMGRSYPLFIQAAPTCPALFLPAISK